ncbi:MAG: prepilin-type N-terminal cleavage/methylation domain-containing protein [Patescibacteria group bacterium]
MRFLPKRGFTLIELMVVVAIIAILVTIGLVTYRGAQARARDAEKISNLKAIQAALEQEYDPITGHYPTGIGSNQLTGYFSDNEVPDHGSYTTRVTSPNRYCVSTTNLNSNMKDSHANCYRCYDGYIDTEGTINKFCLTNLQ